MPADRVTINAGADSITIRQVRQCGKQVLCWVLSWLFSIAIYVVLRQFHPVIGCRVNKNAL